MGDGGAPDGRERDHIYSGGVAEGGYEAKALGYSIYTQAETLEELKGMIQDAVRCHFDEETRPRVIRLDSEP